MLKIRLARAGRRKLPFYQVVLTEHTKKPQGGFKEKLGRFNPLKHEMELDIEAIKSRIGKGAKPSERVAKLAFSQTKDEMFKKYYEEKNITRAVRNPDKHSS